MHPRLQTENLKLEEKKEVGEGRGGRGQGKRGRREEGEEEGKVARRGELELTAGGLPKRCENATIRPKC